MLIYVDLKAIDYIIPKLFGLCRLSSTCKEQDELLEHNYLTEHPRTKPLCFERYQPDPLLGFLKTVDHYSGKYCI